MLLVNYPFIHYYYCYCGYSYNLLINTLKLKSDDVAVIGDFGLAKLVLGGQVGGLLRTWKWLPPEVFSTENPLYDQRTDIYSFGIVLWELAALEIPFEEYATHPKYSNNGILKEREIKQAIIDEDLRPTIPDDIPNSLKQLIKVCWSKNCDDRPTTFDIVQELKEIISEASNGTEVFEDDFQDELNNDKDNFRLSTSQLVVKNLDNFDVVSKNNPIISSINPILRWYTEEEIDTILFTSGNIWVSTSMGKIIVASFSYEVISFLNFSFNILQILIIIFFKLFS